LDEPFTDPDPFGLTCPVVIEMDFSAAAGGFGAPFRGKGDATSPADHRNKNTGNGPIEPD